MDTLELNFAKGLAISGNKVDGVAVPVIIVFTKMGLETEAMVEALNECKYMKHILNCR